MNRLPKILISLDKKQEERLFIKFLNHPEFPQHRQLILRLFPNLSEMLESHKNEKGVIKKFITQYYLKHKDAITSAIRESRKELEPASKAIKALGEAMDYNWQKGVNYMAKPTILPFSPFNKNTFYFSIFDRIKGTGKRNVLTTAIHEISHFIFFDFLKKIERGEKISLSSDAKYYAKETLTTAIFNEEPLRGVLKIDNYRGNPEIRDIYVTTQNGSEKTFIEYTRNQYLKNKKSGNDFKKFLTEYVQTISEMSDEFFQKRKIWNQWGNKLFKNQSEFAQYQKPIVINSGLESN